MAQAQVIVTGVDRTKAAINSAIAGMKSLERTAKVTAKVMRFSFLGFALIAGDAVKSIKAVAESSAKTKEGADAMKRLKDALADPAFKEAASSIGNTLTNAFTSLVNLSAAVVENLNAIAKTNIFKDADTLVKLFAMLSGGTGGAALGGMIASANAQAAGIKAQVGISGGPGRRFTAATYIPPTDEETRMANYHKAQMERLKKEADAQKKLAEEAKKARQNTLEAEAARTEMYRKFYEDLKETPNLLQISFDATDVTIASSVQNMIDEMNMADEMMANFARQAAASIQTAFADFLFDPFQNGLRGMVKGFIDAIRRMIAELMASYLLRQFFQWISGFGGIVGSVGAFAMSTLSGRAMGGPVTGNTPYMVGERGPELFVPNTSGSIVPNHAMGGVTVSPVYNIDARGATADLQKALPGIMAENNRRIFDELDRRYGIGR